MSELTGKTRHRVHRGIFDYILVLQVEFRCVDHGGDTAPASYYNCTHWRDAKVEDLKEIYGTVQSNLGD